MSLNDCSIAKKLEKHNSDKYAQELTKREYFAGLAMQGLLSSVTMSRDEIRDFIVATSVAYADALLAELEKKK